MLHYFRSRLLIAIPVLWGVSTLVFAMLHLTPGDPVELMLSQSGATRKTVEQMRTQLGLDDPLPIQYVRFLGNALRGDLGDSIINDQSVVKLILAQLPSTLELAVAGMAIGILLGGILGIVAALRPNTLSDYGSMIIAMVGVSVPSFWLGLLFIFFFALRLGWFPATGQGGWERLVMPATVLGLGVAGMIARLVRSSMLEVLRQEYITTARAKGLFELRVVLRHALKNALIPTVTMVGLQFGQLLSGAVIVETVFARQGVGRLAVDAILRKDFPLVQGTVLFIAVIYVVSNLFTDICYGYLDPRIRFQ
ncbi:Glutathione transport system permease protein GsiC [Methylococcales bacterium]|nr:Glutathione transport system permease protein GsiC [Methylococcales bacterium]